MIYLIHFASPYKHARHYTGCTNDLTTRLHQHRAGTGARLMEVVTQAGIAWELAATWEGSYPEEQALKAQHNGPRHCPICRQQRLLARMGL